MRQQGPPRRVVRPQSASSRAATAALLDGTDSEAESSLLREARRLGLPVPETQVHLVPGRRFRYDAVWTEWKVAVEVQGGVYAHRGAKKCPQCGETPSGKHTRGAGYESNATKSALAQIQGYIVLYITPRMIKKGEAGKLITTALQAHGWQ
jgi:hypothetical protein